MRRGYFLYVVTATGAGARPLGALSAMPGASLAITEIKLKQEIGYYNSPWSSAAEVPSETDTEFQVANNDSG